MAQHFRDPLLSLKHPGLLLVVDLIPGLGTSTCHRCGQKTKKKSILGSSCYGSAVTDLISIHEGAGSIPGLVQWVKDLVLP